MITKLSGSAVTFLTVSAIPAKNLAVLTEKTTGIITRVDQDDFLSSLLQFTCYSTVRANWKLPHVKRINISIRKYVAQSHVDHKLKSTWAGMTLQDMQFPIDTRFPILRTDT